MPPMPLKKKKRGPRAKRRAEILKLPAIRTDNVKRTRGASNGAPGPLRRENGSKSPVLSAAATAPTHLGSCPGVSTCCVCGGRGVVQVPASRRRCAHCRGTGAIKTFTCTVCRGTRLCPVDPRSPARLPGVPGNRRRRRLGPGLPDLPGARLGAPGKRLANRITHLPLVSRGSSIRSQRSNAHEW